MVEKSNSEEINAASHTSPSSTTHSIKFVSQDGTRSVKHIGPITRETGIKGPAGYTVSMAEDAEKSVDYHFDLDDKAPDQSGLVAHFDLVDPSVAVNPEKATFYKDLLRKLGFFFKQGNDFWTISASKLASLHNIPLDPQAGVDEPINKNGIEKIFKEQVLDRLVQLSSEEKESLFNTLKKGFIQPQGRFVQNALQVAYSGKLLASGVILEFPPQNTNAGFFVDESGALKFINMGQLDYLAFHGLEEGLLKIDAGYYEIYSVDENGIKPWPDEVHTFGADSHLFDGICHQEMVLTSIAEIKQQRGFVSAEEASACRVHADEKKEQTLFVQSGPCQTPIEEIANFLEEAIGYLRSNEFKQASEQERADFGLKTTVVREQLSKLASGQTLQAGVAECFSLYDEMMRSYLSKTFQEKGKNRQFGQLLNQHEDDMLNVCKLHQHKPITVAPNSGISQTEAEKDSADSFKSIRLGAQLRAQEHELTQMAQKLEGMSIFKQSEVVSSTPISESAPVTRTGSPQPGSPAVGSKASRSASAPNLPAPGSGNGPST